MHDKDRLVSYGRLYRLGDGKYIAAFTENGRRHVRRFSLGDMDESSEDSEAMIEMMMRPP